jgi:hypothetical protein
MRRSRETEFRIQNDREKRRIAAAECASHIEWGKIAVAENGSYIGERRRGARPSM